MQIEGLGGGVMFLIAAVLWFVYLLPTWMRRREYLATERNAVRLQQTIRVLAESAEVPDAVRREQAARERVAEERARAAAEKDFRRANPPQIRTGNVRGARATASLVLFVSVLVTVAAIASSAWMLVAGSVGAGLSAAILLGSLARTREVRQVPVEVPVVQERVVRVGTPERAASVASQRSWTPVPVPKPLYIDTPAPQTITGSVEHVAAMRRAAAEAELRLRDAAASSVTPIGRAASASASRPTSAPGSSRFASMGIVDASQTRGATDLDEVLRKRRAV